MRIAILGTGSVGQTLAARLTDLGHEVTLGTRNPDETVVRTAKDFYGGPSFSEWYHENQQVKLATFSRAAAFGELIIVATQGINTLNALKQAGVDNLNGKVLIDITNPLDFSKGMPPTLISELCNTNSLGEEIQRRFPGARVVKAFNTMWCGLMVNPSLVGNGEHNVFICGNDAMAKIQVKELLMQFGWTQQQFIDLGDITASRGTEMVLPLWLRIMQSVGNGAFNFRVVKGKE